MAATARFPQAVRSLGQRGHVTPCRNALRVRQVDCTSRRKHAETMLNEARRLGLREAPGRFEKVGRDLEVRGKRDGPMHEPDTAQGDSPFLRDDLAKNRREDCSTASLRSVGGPEQPCKFPRLLQSARQILNAQAFPNRRVPHRPEDQIPVPQAGVGVLGVPREECRLLPAVGKGKHFPPPFRQQLDQRRGDDGIRAVRAVDDLLDRIAEATTAVIASRTLSEPVRVVLVRLAAHHVGRRVALTAQLTLRYRARTGGRASCRRFWTA